MTKLTGSPGPPVTDAARRPLLVNGIIDDYNRLADEILISMVTCNMSMIMCYRRDIHIYIYHIRLNFSNLSFRSSPLTVANPDL